MTRAPLLVLPVRELSAMTIRRHQIQHEWPRVDCGKRQHT